MPSFRHTIAMEVIQTFGSSPGNIASADSESLSLQAGSPDGSQTGANDQNVVSSTPSLKLRLAVPPRRHSTRTRKAPSSYLPEPLDLRPQRVTKKDSRPKKKPEPKPEPKPKRQPQVLVKLRYCDVQPVPHFEPVKFADNNSELFWLKLSLREFFFRFDKLSRLPVRHATTISDPLCEWNEFVLKAAMISLFKIILNDTQPVAPNAKAYYTAIEHTPADSPSIWETLSEFLAEADHRPTSAVAQASRESELAGEHRWLSILRRLQVLASGSETIRITVTGDQEELHLLQKQAQENVAHQKKAFTETQAKLEKLKAYDENLWKQRFETAQKAMEGRVYKLEQTIYQQLRKYNLRTAPLGTDNYGNRYWGLQYRPRDESWGNWILCEMQRIPREDDAKRMANYVDQLLARAPKRKRDDAKATKLPTAPKRKSKVAKQKDPASSSTIKSETKQDFAGELPEPVEVPEAENSMKEDVKENSLQNDTMEQDGNAIDATAAAAVDTQKAVPQIPQLDGALEPDISVQNSVASIDAANSEPNPKGPESLGSDSEHAKEGVDAQLAEIKTESKVENASEGTLTKGETPVDHVVAKSNGEQTAQIPEKISPEISNGAAEIKPKKLRAKKPKGAASESPISSESKRVKPEGEAIKKPRQRRPKMPTFSKDGGLFTVSGPENLKRLASWIRGQVGPPQTALASEIESMAHYLYN